MRTGKGRPPSPLTHVFWGIRNRGAESQRLPAVCTRETYEKAVETHYILSSFAFHGVSLVFNV